MGDADRGNDAELGRLESSGVTGGERGPLLEPQAPRMHKQMRLRRRGKAKEVLASVLSSWAYKKFMTGCAILFPIAVTVYISLCVTLNSDHSTTIAADALVHIGVVGSTGGS